MKPAPGAVIGRYEIRSLLGEGGMGRVYRAYDAQLGREVALKVLDPLVAADPERVHRFLQEARAASGLNHPNIIAIYEAGEANGVRFIASELVDGRTLRDMLAGGPLPLAQALDIASQVASALAAAHASGIVHRDVKPENIMVRPDGYAKVLDFGLAKLSDPSASGAHPAPDAAATMLQTTAGVIMGTVAYMSPEQARALKVDARTDCYSLGAVIFEMITGRQPFTGATGTDVMVAILERDAPLDVLRREGLPAQLVWVVAKSLDKNPDLRHQNAADLRVDLDRIRRDIATGAVYSDGVVQTGTASAILRDVTDSDADAVALYRLSPASLVVVALGILCLIALPFIYARTAGAKQPGGLADAAAEIRARDIAQALGRPLDGRTATAALDRSELNLKVVRNLGDEELSRAIREGHAAQWEIEVSGSATDERPGAATILLTPDGKLRAFRSTPRTNRPRVTQAHDAAIARAAGAARQYLGADVSAYTIEHAGLSADGTSFDIAWKNPSKVFGHDETIRANLDDSGFSTLSRNLSFRETDDTSLSRRVQDARGVILILAIAGVFVLGLVVLVRQKRWQMVGRPLPIAMSACIVAGFLALTSNDNGNIVSVVALLAVGLLIAVGALPSFAGVYAWLKQGGALRLLAAEQLAAGHLRSPSIAVSLLVGIAVSGIVAASAMGEWVIGLRLEGYTPSVSRELNVATPGLYVDAGAWMTAALCFALVIAVLFELSHRLFVRGRLVAFVLAAIAGVVVSGGDPLWLSAATTIVPAIALMMVYASTGLLAVFVGVLFTPLLTDLLAAKAVGGPVAGPRGTALIAVTIVLAAFALWSYLQSRRGAGTPGSDSRRSKISSKLGL